MVRQKNLRTARKCAPSKSKCLRCGAFCLIVSSWLSREWHLDFVLSAENGRLGFVGKSQLSGVRANQLLTSRKAEPSRWRRVRDWLIDAENRKRFASMGTAGVLSYGVVSNINYIPLFSYAWYLVAVRSKASPIHQWPAFLSTYATLYIFNNVLRPIKLVVIGFVTPELSAALLGWWKNLGLEGREQFCLFMWCSIHLLSFSWVWASLQPAAWLECRFGDDFLMWMTNLSRQHVCVYTCIMYMFKDV